MIVVDSSVWIDFLTARDSPQTSRLDQSLSRERVIVGDLIKVEVLQGFRDDRQFATARRLMDRCVNIDIAGQAVVTAAVQNYRILRSPGVTVRKTIDCLIATRCIEDGHSLLFSDRDFQPFVDHLGLVAA